MAALNSQRFEFPAMGSRCEITLYNESPQETRRLAGRLVDEVRRLEQKYSRYREDSVTTAINASAGDHVGVDLDEETEALFGHARSCFEQSGGLFDITAGLLSRAWDFRQRRMPDADTIRRLRENIGLDRLSWRNARLSLPAAMEVDFGGIVKEYAADSAARLGRKLGIAHGLVNLGGDLAVIGPQPGDRPWPVGIVDPEGRKAADIKSQNGAANGGGPIMARIELSAGGLASSGDYARYFDYGGKRYSHLINPHTGWPSTGMRAVSVAAPLCTVAGSMATIAMLMDSEAAESWLFDSGLPYSYMRADGSRASSAPTAASP